MSRGTSARRAGRGRPRSRGCAPGPARVRAGPSPPRAARPPAPRPPAPATPASGDQLLRAAEQEVDLRAEELVDRLVRPALEELRIAALERDGELPAGEDVVPGEVPDVALRGGRVAVDQLCPTREVVGREPRFLRTAERHGALRGVEDQRPGEIDERVADRRHLPVDDGQEPGWSVGREEDVVELVVPVAEREGLLDGRVVAQP